MTRLQPKACRVLTSNQLEGTAEYIQGADKQVEEAQEKNEFPNPLENAENLPFGVSLWGGIWGREGTVRIFPAGTEMFGKGAHVSTFYHHWLLYQGLEAGRPGFLPVLYGMHFMAPSWVFLESEEGGAYCALGREKRRTRMDV